VPADFRTLLARLGDRFVSEGHAGRFEALVWANDGARSGLAIGKYPEGAMLVEEALAGSTADAGTLGLLVMEKRGSGWRFATVDADGAVVSDDRVSACATCHKDAAHDFVFPVQSSNAAATPAMNATAPSTVATAAPTYDARSAGSAAAPSSR
jgi:hypothetical protein